ncbi:serine hydrolase [Cellulomonas sp. GbtcB1]|uniref:serine hydrolase domain-containing protein n=1 Tax=Cellulomonas sp. GbtcB1 TaxID=2824746 RepID=UPI001C2FE85B|nr:serine hydrolase domain-containing protein [Cellulomonas sp. GbtcB1]
MIGFGEALDALDELDPHALVVARHGTVLARATWAPYDAEHAGLVYSVSKSVTALAVLLLESEGRLALSDPVDRHLDLPNPHGFTLRHLLTMSTGHSREQTSVMPADPAVLLTTPPEFPVGTRFAYSSPATCTLGRVVHAVAGEQPTGYLRPRLLDPLRIGPRWWRPLAGVEQGFSGLHLTVDDQARLGMALAAGGVAPDGTRVLPADVVEAMATTFVPTADTFVEDHQGPEPDTAHDDWALGYGYGVWRSRHGYRMDGAYGQFTLVVPESGVVVAYQGSAMDTQRVLDVLWGLVAAAASGPAEAAGAGARDASGGAVSSAAALLGGVAERDSWAARDRYVASDAPALDVAGWTLDDAGPDAGPAAWRLTIPASDGQPGGVVDLRPDAWSRGSLALRPGDVASGAPSDPVPDGVVPVAARAERLPDGTVRAHLVATASPHRLLVTRAPDGALSARWHTAPLWEPTLATLLVPPLVAAPARGPS